VRPGFGTPTFLAGEQRYQHRPGDAAGGADRLSDAPFSVVRGDWPHVDATVSLAVVCTVQAADGYKPIGDAGKRALMGACAEIQEIGKRSACFLRILASTSLPGQPRWTCAYCQPSVQHASSASTMQQLGLPGRSLVAFGLAP
jgi:hypothetical protein